MFSSCSSSSPFTYDAVSPLSPSSSLLSPFSFSAAAAVDDRSRLTVVDLQPPPPLPALPSALRPAPASTFPAVATPVPAIIADPTPTSRPAQRSRRRPSSRAPSPPSSFSSISSPPSPIGSNDSVDSPSAESRHARKEQRRRDALNRGFDALLMALHCPAKVRRQDVLEQAAAQIERNDVRIAWLSQRQLQLEDALRRYEAMTGQVLSQAMMPEWAQEVGEGGEEMKERAPTPMGLAAGAGAALEVDTMGLELNLSFGEAFRRSLSSWESSASSSSSSSPSSSPLLELGDDEPHPGPFR